MKLQCSLQILEIYSNIKFHEKSAQPEPSCSMQVDGRTDITKLIVAFCTFAKTPLKKKEESSSVFMDRKDLRICRF